MPSPPPPRTAKKASAAAASSRRCCGSSSDASGADRPNWAQSNSSMPRGAGLGGGAHGRGSVRGAKQGEYEAENKEAISRAHSHPYCASCMTATKVGSTLYTVQQVVQGTAGALLPPKDNVQDMAPKTPTLEEGPESNCRLSQVVGHLGGMAGRARRVSGQARNEHMHHVCKHPDTQIGFRV